MKRNGMQKQKKNIPLALKPPLLGAGLLFCAFLLLTQNDSPVMESLGSAHDGVFVRVFMLGVALGCLEELLRRRFGYLIAGMRDSSLSKKSQSKLPWSLFIAGAVATLGSALVALGSALSFLELPSVMFLGVVIGMAFIPLTIGWAELYARELPENALVHAALALVLSALLYCIAQVSPLAAEPLASVCVLLVLATFVGAGMHRISAAATTDVSVLHEEVAGASLPFANIIRMLWKPLLSGSISALIVGLVWDPFAAEVATQTEITQVLMLNLGAPLVAALMVVGAFFLRPRSFSLHLLNDVVMPVAIAILLVAPLVEFEGIDLSALTGFFCQVCFALVVLAAWISLAVGVRTLGENTWAIFGVCLAPMALCMLGGMYAIYVIGTNGRVLCLVLLTLFLVLMVVDFALSKAPEATGRERMKEVLEHFLQRRCDVLSERSGLSAREQEVFLYLARGYGQVYIAKELYVSENTIRTHVRHIYAKLNISSREELIQLIDELL